MNCRICYSCRKGKKEIPLKDIRRLYRSIRSCGVRIEILGGEPLLHGDLIEIIRSAKQGGPEPVHHALYQRDPGDPRPFVEYEGRGPRWSHRFLLVPSESVHDALTREPGSWAAAVQGMRRMSEAGITVYTFTPVLRHNVADVPDIYEFVRSRLRANPLFYQYIPGSRDDDLNIRPEEWQRAKRWILDRATEHWAFVRRFYRLSGNSCSGGTSY
ncbi:MAG: hypothetical protein MZW92_03350 [Comamonadaceae bacterium]|nr:hypothetical protein [Comamonadaceae bacterium]